jgi:diaminohydroxyphosphoribosylaminopyrimidine deaminase / 5-amino-6-(5-phosphoribosylamino)uracil reductase
VRGPTLDEAAAWQALLQVPKPLGQASHPVEVRAGPCTLTFRATGEWESSGPVTPEAMQLLDLYTPLVVPAALVIGQMGQSLDGRIATASGHSHYVTGPEDIRRLHRVRALVDAVVVGVGTAVADDPRLTVRAVEGPNPVRVVLDPGGRLPADARLLTDAASSVIVIRRAGGGASTGAGAGGESPPGNMCLTLPVISGEGFPTLFTAQEGFLPGEVITLLRERGLRRILVEGGGITVSRFLRAGVLDRLHVTVAPLIVGEGKPGLSLPPVSSLNEALRPRSRRFLLGEDVLFDLELRPDRSPDRS